MERQFFIYIMANKKHGTIYTGVTNDLIARVWQHKNNIREGFTSKYDLHRLVYFEPHGNTTSVISREKQIKKWHRKWKIQLIEKQNPEWRDLYEEIV